MLSSTSGILVLHVATVTCKSDANPPARFTWKKKVKNWRGETVEINLVEDSYTGELKFYNLTTNDSATYICLAENNPDDKSPSAVYAQNKEIEIIVRCKFNFDR